jgi:adenylate cyclase
MLGLEPLKTGASLSGEKSLLKLTRQTKFPSRKTVEQCLGRMKTPALGRLAASMLPQLRLPQPIKDLLWFVLIGAAVGAVYGHMNAISGGAPLLGFGGLPRGVLTGVVITGALFFFEQVWARPAMARLRGLPFLPHLVIKTAIYLLIVLVGLAVGAELFPVPAEAGVRLPIRHQDVLFSFVVVLVIRFIDDINHLLGQNVLRHFITGYYHRPRLEERVFLFIDVEGSTALAERLGEFAFHSLINRFVVDITEPIVAAYGEIHRYVGDELIASWKLADGIANGHCVRACFDAFDRLAALSPVYVRDFGTPVHCRAGLHCGPVVTGEMGSVKKEIVFLGDTVNTTARIQEFCRQTSDRVLASAALVNLLELPFGITKRSLGDLHLRGKENDVVLYALEKERADNLPAAA